MVPKMSLNASNKLDSFDYVLISHEWEKPINYSIPHVFIAMIMKITPKVGSRRADSHGKIII